MQRPGGGAEGPQVGGTRQVTGRWVFCRLTLLNLMVTWVWGEKGSPWRVDTGLESLSFSPQKPPVPLHPRTSQGQTGRRARWLSARRPSLALALSRGAGGRGAGWQEGGAPQLAAGRGPQTAWGRQRWSRGPAGTGQALTPLARHRPRGCSVIALSHPPPTRGDWRLWAASRKVPAPFWAPWPLRAWVGHRTSPCRQPGSLCLSRVRG